MSPTASRTAISAVAVFILLLLAAHLLKPDLAPSWHFISEYAIGPYGWVMQAAFWALAIANVATFFAIRQAMQTIGGRVGSFLFLAGTAGLVLAAIFVTDPINTPPEAQTTSGKLHNLGGGLGLLGFIGTLVFSVRLLRHEHWKPARLAVLAATILLVLGFLVSFVSIIMIAIDHKGVFGPDTPIGWPNRIGIGSGCAWLVIVAWQARLIALQSKEVSES